VEKTTSKQRDTEPLLSAEGRQVRAYWHELGYEATSASNEYWNTLSKHIQTFEQFKSLYEYTRSKLVGAKDETVYPGNLVKCVNGWKQKQTPAPVEAKATVYKPRDLAAEMRAMEAKYSKPAGRN
jgi:hypothetical protein